MDLYFIIYLFFQSSIGYASHLANLAIHQCRPAKINPYLLVPRGCLSLPGHGAPLLRRRYCNYWYKCLFFFCSCCSSCTPACIQIYSVCSCCFVHTYFDASNYNCFVCWFCIEEQLILSLSVIFSLFMMNVKILGSIKLWFCPHIFRFISIYQILSCWFISCHFVLFLHNSSELIISSFLRESLSLWVVGFFFFSLSGIIHFICIWRNDDSNQSVKLYRIRYYLLLVCFDFSTEIRHMFNLAKLVAASEPQPQWFNSVDLHDVYMTNQTDEILGLCLLVPF